MLNASSLGYTAAGTLQDLTLSNYGSTPLTIRGITSTDSSFTVDTNGCGTMLQAQSVCTITVKSSGFYESSQQFTSYSGTLKIDDDASAGAQTVALSSTNTFLVSGTPDTGYFGSTITFGAWPVGEPISSGLVTIDAGDAYTQAFASVTVTGTNASDFKLTSFNCTAGPYVGTGSTNCSLPLTFTAGGTGARTAMATINGKGYIRLTGTGDPAGASFYQTGSNVSNTSSLGAGGATTASTYTFLNNGTTTLNFSYAFTGANSSNYSASGMCGAVAPQASCAVTVTFNAPAAGTYAAALAVRDGSSGVSQSVALSTLVYTPVVAANPSTINFVSSYGVQAVGTTSPGIPTSIYNGSTNSPLADPVSAVNTRSFQLQNGSTCPGSTTQLCTLRVVFTPLATGPVTEYMTVTDTTTGNTATLTLQGTGGAPVVLLSATSITFPSRSTGTTSLPMM